jgi:hypothetical protein
MNQWLTGLAGLGLGSIVAAVIAGLFSKRKLSAEATKIITEAASDVVEIQKGEIARVSVTVDQLRAEVRAAQDREKERDKRERERDHAILLHGFWDTQVFTMARDQGITLPEPPPLPTQGA